MSRNLEFAVGEFYHLYNRGVEKRKIFLNPADYMRFSVLLYLANGRETIHISNQKNTSKTDFFLLSRGKTLVDIGAYCLMPNHFHFLVREKVENGISIFMQKLLTAYTMYFNKRHERKGTLFEGPFQAKHASHDTYLKYLFSYLHLNPIQLFDSEWKTRGIKNSRAAEEFLHDYTHSSFLDYIYKERPEKAILNRAVFPDYFETPRDFKMMLREWLSFSHQGEALMGMMEN